MLRPWTDHLKKIVILNYRNAQERSRVDGSINVVRDVLVGVREVFETLPGAHQPLHGFVESCEFSFRFIQIELHTSCVGLWKFSERN